MSRTIGMPRLSDSMEEGTIVRWLKDDGAAVDPGDELVEIETDKATSTYEADEGGVLRILAAEGDTVAVGAAIAQLGGAGEPSAVVATAVAPMVGVADAGNGRAPRPRATPLARRIARDHGLELTAIAGSGPAGRVVRRDVEGVLASASASAAPAAPPPPPPAPAHDQRGAVTVHELTRAQQVVAARMSQSRSTVPDFEVRTRVDLQAAIDLRAELKAVDPEGAPSVNDLVVKAAALAVRDVPRANGAFLDGRWELYERVNVGIAVATADSLLVPTIFDADRATVGEIARRSRELAARAREGTLTPAELAGGTFTVSNLGMFGVTGFSPVIFAPQAAILAVGAAVPTPVSLDGEVVVRAVAELALACDHRILYGADGARVLARIRELLEQPLRLLAG